MTALRPESEHIERAALVDLHAAASEDIVASLGISASEIGSAFVSVAGALPPSAIVINRSVGFGADGDTGDERLRQIIDAYETAGVERYFLCLFPGIGDEAIVPRLERHGLAKARGWQKFSRGRVAVQGMASNLRTRLVGPEYGEDFGRIVADAFDLGAEAGPWLARLPGREGWHIFMSFDGDEPAGAGALYIEDDLAWTDFGATRPEFRRRRSQGALLAQRIECALDHGCTKIFTCTGEAAAGDEQHSYRNILRSGFEIDYLRQNYAPAR